MCTNLFSSHPVSPEKEVRHFYRRRHYQSIGEEDIGFEHLLFLNLNKLVSRNTILDKIYEWTGNDVDSHTITVYFQRIRQKLGTDIISTVKGLGYRIDYEK